MHTTSGQWKLGLALALVTAACWGLLPIALSITLRVMDAYTITWYRFAVSAIALGLFLAWRRRLPRLGGLGRRGWGMLTVALLGLLANYVLYLVALGHTGPTAAQVLIQLAPVFLLFGGLLVFRERFAPLQWAGFAALLGGLLLFFHGRLAQVFALGTELGLGVALLLLASLTWAVYGLAQKQLLIRLTSGQVLFLLYVGALALLLPAAQPRQVLALDALQLAMLAFCCANTVVAYGCFAEALEHWEVSRVSAVVTLAPLVTLIGVQVAGRAWPAQVLAEQTTWVGVAGALLVVAGAMTTAIAARPVSAEPESVSPPPA